MEEKTQQDVICRIDLSPFISSAMATLQNCVHRNAIDHGWHEQERSDAEMIALEHSEFRLVILAEQEKK